MKRVWMIAVTLRPVDNLSERITFEMEKVKK
ncbi:hypothetical protein SAMN05192532_106131 [Alteribacillus iranensis]|uniref:Uncharacterized protein n=1 Tax=Alteribacillus iranensis TaxID=930128 RepID=A0A1I2ENX1_9BACI|nr:hypothetical protein SAMN05192532_106131 [Alteribacillus iranensis]